MVPRLGVGAQPVGFIALEDGGIEAVFREFVHLGEQFPGPVDGLFLEIVPETPVAEHFKHRVVIGIVADLFEVVVLAADAKAFLTVRHPLGCRRCVAEENILELVHAGIGKHQRGVVLDHHGGRRHDGVPLACKEVREGLPDLFDCHRRVILVIWHKISFFPGIFP